MQKYNIGILVFDDVEVLDFAGPFEVFTVTAELMKYNFIEVFTVAEEKTLIKAKNGLKIMPEYAFNQHPEISILIIPGGFGTRKLLHRTSVKEWLEQVDNRSLIMASVCSGALILGRFGYLDGLECTTHHDVVEELKILAPLTKVLEEERFIDSGTKIMTSAGVATGIDLSLYIVKKLLGHKVCDNTMKYMEYGDWKKL